MFLLGYLPGRGLRRYNRLGDYSYGTYVYAFPVQQLVQHLWGPFGPGVVVALALPATLLLAVVSWRWVERPALALARGPGAGGRRPRAGAERPARGGSAAAGEQERGPRPELRPGGGERAGAGERGAGGGESPAASASRATM